MAVGVSVNLVSWLLFAVGGTLHRLSSRSLDELRSEALQVRPMTVLASRVGQ